MASAFIAVLEIFLPIFPLEEKNYKRRGKFGQFVKKGGNSADFGYKGECHYTSLWAGQKGLQMALQSRFCTDCPCHSPPFYCMMTLDIPAAAGVEATGETRDSEAQVSAPPLGAGAFA
ncbi:hypothetical protein H7271_03080 [Bittarella massiliensis]|uniref:hypothetical protein n=1 Tax=Bittarella massiliensis (ex Durand et al. 2017) TaxID=1720313 RepID=UPI00163C2DEA|nr:hypothetical protein [Bittarella massiliensis (ex Durand et al. 2017)]MBC2870590.1 hypothetical protein [Bittarella massiliensis (ex Durand et al. 2017)]